MTIANWSTTPSNNATADSASGISWPEGMAPGQVNDSARAMMAVIAADFAGGNGYARLPNNKLIQWGQSAQASSDYGITFPTAFSGAPIVVASTEVSGTPFNALYAVHTDQVTSTSFVARTRMASGGSVTSNGSIPIRYVAIGGAP